MFGLGASELLVIFIIALIFIGPKKLPELAKGLGKGIRDFQNAAKGLTDQLHDEANSESPKTPQVADATRKEEEATPTHTPDEKDKPQT